MIHICFALNDPEGNRAKFTGTAMLSIFENTASKVTVHILHDDTLTPENLAKLSEVAARFRQAVKFYNVGELCANKLAEYLSILPALKDSSDNIGVAYNFLIPQVLPRNISKVIRLDSEIIANLDLEELWQIELGDKPVAAVPSYRQSPEQEGLKRVRSAKMCLAGLVKPEDYCSSGVLLVNLKVWRKEESLLTEGFRFMGEHPEYRFFDREILNYCFAERVLKLPVKFNRYVGFARSDIEEPIGKNTYNYSGHSDSLGLDMTDDYNRLWMGYFLRTPWFNVNSIQQIYETLEQREVFLKDFMLELAAAMAGKTRVFVVRKSELDLCKKIFSVRDNEEIIIVEENAPNDELIKEMRKARGKKVFFIMVRKFPFSALTKAGLGHKKDFFNGYFFRSKANGKPMDSYPLVQAM